MKSYNTRAETHFVLWLLLAFAVGTLWTPLVDLAWNKFHVDNTIASEGHLLNGGNGE